MNTGKAVAGILAGIAVGTAIGIMIAPHKGWRTRKFMKRRARDLADLVNEKIEEKLEDVAGIVSPRACKPEKEVKAA